MAVGDVNVDELVLDPAKFLDWLTDYYLVMLAGHQQRVFDEEDRAYLRRSMAFCWNLKQIHFFPGGFIAYVRADHAHLEVLFSRNEAAIAALGERELTTGNVLFCAEVMAVKPREAIAAIRRLSHLPGVEYLAAWRDLDRRKVQRVHHNGKLSQSA